jgi:ribosomal protein L11 methyltransferase
VPDGLTVFLELELKPVPRTAVEGLSAQLFAAGAVGLQEDWLEGEAPSPRQPWDRGPAPPEPGRIVLRAWFEDPDRAAVEAAVQRGGATLRWVEVEDRDWDEVWKRGFGPIVVGDGLTVAPPWDAPDGALIIEPGQGFGTGQHPSTLQALRFLLRLAAQGQTALDVGSGSGILALAAARLGMTASGIDVEASAVRDADRNAAANGFAPGEVAFSTTPLARVSGRFDLVLANLHAELVIALAPELVRVTGGALVVAGILADREERVHAVLQGAGLVRSDRDLEGEWDSAVYRREGAT